MSALSLRFPLFRHAIFPSAFRRQVGRLTYGTFSESHPMCSGRAILAVTTHGLLPGHGALLQEGQDAVGDDLVRCCDLGGRHGKTSMVVRVMALAGGEHEAPARLRVRDSRDGAPQRDAGAGAPTAGAGSAVWRRADRG